MEDHHAVGGEHLVDQVGCPKQGQLFLLTQLPDVFQNRLSADQVQPHSGFIQDHQLRLVQQGPHDFHPPHLPAAELPDFLVAVFLQPQSAQFLCAALLGVCAVDSVERGEVQEVLLNGQVHVQRALLEHHAKLFESYGGVGADVMSKNANGTGMRIVKAGDQGEQRGLARAILPQQHREVSGFDPKRHSV